MSPPLVVLMASRPTLEYLLEVSLPSVVSQSLLPDEVVIVADKMPFTDVQQQVIAQCLPGIPVSFLYNRRAPGAAGAWNTGLDYVQANYPEAWVAILDDDDLWQTNHLQSCAELVADNVDAVISGIEVRRHGETLALNTPKDLKYTDFLVKNPGWQGSNTFVRLSAIQAVGGFTDGLVSCNDRDLAIRMLLRAPERFRYTDTVTVVWHCNQSEEALSAPNSPQKRKGCAQFLRLHEHRMSPADKQAFFGRLQTLFKISEADIMEEYQSMDRSIVTLSAQSSCDVSRNPL
ncbi:MULTISPECIES: glycosyltransferase family 2 protein [Shewanella]|uniref:glycosyltransferase family 2 protein n=1 Tax=Shewanella TaxID=22 RepID=UPI001181FB7F|nr:glycosyltransferase family A protein [Shewanella algae]MBO2661871.1 glycosyltransferase family 2 protein [Shewanella algae]MCL1053051.1 glycosyltransferase family 2 protein [Shewanella algae]TVO87712.1 hypothetical protein AYI80_14630 [Shewanella algae]TXS85041.1 hypothetical protein AYI81_17200 [Shewanella algae]